jgi:hypothetical protein
MANSQENLPKLSRNPDDIDNTAPFEGDLLNRRELAIKLTGYLDRLKEGAVIAIDAPWGEGKTWFGKNWEQYLRENNRKVLYIDAFKHDYIEDPFVLLASEFFNLAHGDDQALENLKDKASKVAKATMSIGTKVGMNILTKSLLGNINISEEIEKLLGDAGGEMSNFTSKWVEAKFDEHEQDKQSILAFKEELQTFSSSQEHPIVIFIDELDRCKPDFAVGLIERIKHFFDVPNIVFVLLLNREQIESAIKGIYGVDTQASAYLGKFINFFFRLPKHTIYSRTYTEKYIAHTFEKYNFPNQNIQSLIDVLSALTLVYDLSLRDIEKIIALYAFAYPDTYNGPTLIYVATLKQKDYVLFGRLLAGETDAHREMANILSNFQTKNGTSFFINMFQEWHEAYLNNFDTSLMGDRISRSLNQMQSTNWGLDLTYEQIFPFFAKQIDLTIE